MVSEPRTIDVGTRRFESSELPSFISRQVSEARRFYFDLTGANAKKRIDVAMGGWERVRADYAIHRPKFEYYAVEFVAEGRGRVQVAGEDHELSPGAVFGYSPGSPIEIFTSSRELMSKYYVAFTGTSAHKILKWAGLAPQGFKRMHTKHDVREIFELMIANGLAHTRFSQPICAALLSTLAYKIAEQAIPKDTVLSRAYATYLQIRELIDQNYLNIKSVEQAADQCGLSVPYICQLFKRFDHVSPYQYLLRQRMRFAADLLSTPGMLVKQAALRLEFADQFQFSRAFKRVFGISPAQFQRRLVPAERLKRGGR